MTDQPDLPPLLGGWEIATVVEIRAETANAKTFRLALGDVSRHLAGQHYVVRLTAPDGYTATRSYSVASAPDGTAAIELTVERLEDGEVSSFLHDVAAVGDTLEVRGPIGGWFVWRGDTPALLVGGGSGIVPLMAMLRLARQTGRSDLLRLVVSARSPADLYYADELPGPETTVVYTRTAPPGWPRPAGRLTQADLGGALGPAWPAAGFRRQDHGGRGFAAEGGFAAAKEEPDGPLAPEGTAYVCGSPGFADAATGLLTDVGIPPARIRVERFGPT